MSQSVFAHRMEIFTIHECPQCGHDTPLSAQGQSRELRCPACGNRFPVQPMHQPLHTALQKAFHDYMARIKPEAPPAALTYCFELADSPDRFSFDRLILLEEFAALYSRDPQAAERKFKNTKFCFMGVLDEIGIFEAFVSASLTDPKGNFTVFCDFATKNGMFANLKEGDILIVQGIYQGLLDKNNPMGGVFTTCTLLGAKGRVITTPKECPGVAHELHPKSPNNPHNIRILFSKPKTSPKK